MTLARARLFELSGEARNVRTKNGRELRLVYKPLPQGHIRTPFGACPWTAGKRAASGNYDLRPSAPDVFDQGQTGACEGHMHACCAATAFAAAGSPLPFVPSPAELYRNGRAVDRIPRIDGTFDPLVDEGAYTSSVTRAMQTFGVRAMGPMAPDGRYSDADPSNINDEPGLLDVEEELPHVPIGERAIADCSTGRSVEAVMADIRAALASKMPVGFGTFVDSAFMNWTPGDGPFGACDLHDPNGGGHAISILAANSDGTFIVRNSWSRDWGASGDIYVTSAFLQQISDITVFVPELR